MRDWTRARTSGVGFGIDSGVGLALPFMRDSYRSRHAFWEKLITGSGIVSCGLTHVCKDMTAHLEILHAIGHDAPFPGINLGLEPVDFGVGFEDCLEQDIILGHISLC